MGYIKGNLVLWFRLIAKEYSKTDRYKNDLKNNYLNINIFYSNLQIVEENLYSFGKKKREMLIGCFDKCM